MSLIFVLSNKTIQIMSRIIWSTSCSKLRGITFANFLTIMVNKSMPW